MNQIVNEVKQGHKGCKTVQIIGCAYSKEMYQLSDSKLKKQRKAGSKVREVMLEQQLNQTHQTVRPETAGRPETSRSSNRSVQSHYAFNKPSIPPVRMK